MLVRVTYKDSVNELVISEPGDQLQLIDDGVPTRTFGVTRMMLTDLESGSIVMLGEAKLEKIQ